MPLNTNPTPGEIREMILLTLARADENQRLLSTAALADELGVPVAPLIPELNALAAQGALNLAAQTITLSDTGHTQGWALLRRHRIVERHMTDVLGLDWARAHEEADKFEHLVSRETAAQLAAQLGDPATCPHGNPIPGADANPASNALPLPQCPPHTCASIVRISSETALTLQHLATLGLLPNVQIQIEHLAPFNGPVLVTVGRAHYALGRDLASRIWVRPHHPTRVRARHRHGQHPHQENTK